MSAAARSTSRHRSSATDAVSGGYVYGRAYRHSRTGRSGTRPVMRGRRPALPGWRKPDPSPETPHPWRRGLRAVGRIAARVSSDGWVPPTCAPRMIDGTLTSGRRLDAVRGSPGARDGHNGWKAAPDDEASACCTAGRRSTISGSAIGSGETIASGLEAMAREAKRLAPDADAFRRQATRVADALADS